MGDQLGDFVDVLANTPQGRRDAMTNKLLDELAPHANAFIVYEKGNGDGYFNKAAGSRPLVLTAKTVDVAKVLESLKR